MTWAPPPQYPGPMYQNYAQPNVATKRGLGVSSLVIGVIVLVGEFAAVVAAGVMAMQPGGVDEESPQAVILGLAMMVGLMLAIVGLVLGIVGAASATQHKVFSIIGLLINGLVLLGVVGLLILGSVA